MTHFHFPQDIHPRYSDQEYARLIAGFWQREAEDPLVQTFSYKYPIAGDLHEAPYGYELVLDSALVRQQLEALRLTSTPSPLEDHFERRLP